jgi:O-antigen polymerase
LAITLAVLLTLFFAIQSPKISINFTELLFITLVGFICLKNIFLNTYNITSILFLCFIPILYLGVKKIIASNLLPAKTQLIPFANATALYLYLSFSAYSYFTFTDSKLALYLPNNSIFGILLASQIAFAIPMAVKYISSNFCKKHMAILLLALLLLSCILLIFTNSRAGWVGMICSTIYVVYKNYSIKKFKKQVIFISTILIISIFCTLLFFKKDSSSGRLFIYKISATMLKDNWLLGIGHGQFKVKYNEAQAQYFSTHNINSKEALLADNTIYAFNDFFQLFIENGIISILFATAIFIIFCSTIIRAKIELENKHLFEACIASLICIFVGSLFSYSLQIFPIIFQAILCVSTLNFLLQNNRVKMPLMHTKNRIWKAVVVLISLILTLHFYCLVNYNLKSNASDALNKAGFKTMALREYKYIYNWYCKSGSTLLSHAQTLYYTNNLLEAKKVLNEAKLYNQYFEVYKLSADIENELGNFKQAKLDYLHALHIAPNRMRSRKNLLDFYLMQKDTTNALYWAKSIMNMPVKVKSAITDDIQIRTKEILNRLTE